MRSCAVRRRRRALHDQGHRAVRRRGDIRHRSKGACGASAAMRSLGGCRRTGCDGRLQWAWPRRLMRRATTAAAWCAWRMGPSRSRAARSRTARRCVRPARVARPRAVVWYVGADRHGRWMARTVRRTHAAASGVRCAAHAARVERVSTPFESLAKGRPHRDAECCAAARAGHDARALVRHRVARVPNRKDASFGARCMMRRRALHRRVASACVASACVACCNRAAVSQRTVVQFVV
jgi:hypothetical protein